MDLTHGCQGFTTTLTAGVLGCLALLFPKGRLLYNFLKWFLPVNQGSNYDSHTNTQNYCSVKGDEHTARLADSTQLQQNCLSSSYLCFSVWHTTVASDSSNTNKQI